MNKFSPPLMSLRLTPKKTGFSILSVLNSRLLANWFGVIVESRHAS